MTTELAKLDQDTILKLATGDTSKLNTNQKLDLIVQVCKIAGLDPRLSPFEYIRFQGKEILYARKNAADQLVNIHKIRLEIIQQNTEDDIRIVTVCADTADGRRQMDIGAVNVKGLTGDARANAYMKAVTKAKRRTVLSVCGLSMLDESEIESIPGAKPMGLPARPMPAPAPETPPEPPEAQEEVATALEEARGVLDPGVDPPAMEPAPPPSPVAAAMDKNALARKARVDRIKKAWGSDFQRLAEQTLACQLPPRLSMLSLEQIASLEAAVEAK